MRFYSFLLFCALVFFFSCKNSNNKLATVAGYNDDAAKSVITDTGNLELLISFVNAGYPLLQHFCSPYRYCFAAIPVQ